MKRPILAVAALVATLAVALVAAVASQSGPPAARPAESVGPAPAAVQPGSPAAPPSAPATLDAVPPAATDGAAGAPPGPGAGTPRPANDDSLDECDRRLAANESLFADTLVNGGGAAFHCTTRCTDLAVETPPSRAVRLDGLQAEVSEFVAKAESTGEVAAEEFCLTESGRGLPPAQPAAAAPDSLLPADSPLQDPATDGRDADNEPPRPPARSETPTPRDSFIPFDVFAREPFPKV